MKNLTNQSYFTQRSAPALTELEQIVMNMYARALNLPKHFLSDEVGSKGGGAMQGSSSDAIFAALLVARHRGVHKLKGENKFLDESIFLPSFVAYTSKEAHSCVEKAAKMAIIKLRILPVDEKGRLRGHTVAEAVQKDVAEGLVPIFVSCTVGTTGTLFLQNHFIQLNEIFLSQQALVRSTTSKKSAKCVNSIRQFGFMLMAPTEATHLYCRKCDTSKRDWNTPIHSTAMATSSFYARLILHVFGSET